MLRKSFLGLILSLTVALLLASIVRANVLARAVEYNTPQPDEIRKIGFTVREWDVESSFYSVDKALDALDNPPTNNTYNRIDWVAMGYLGRPRYAAALYDYDNLINQWQSAVNGHDFYITKLDRIENSFLYRERLFNMEVDSFQWVGEYSTDEGATWQPYWELNYHLMQ